MSASSRGNFASALAAKNYSWRSPLVTIGRGDAQRGILLALAIVLTLGAAAVPLLNQATVTAILFIAGASLALIHLACPEAPGERNANGCSPDSDRNLHRAAAPASSAMFQELLAQSTIAESIDRAAWARLTAHMSHELRTPLNAVLGFSELMSNEVFGPMGSSFYSDYARDIHASGRMLLKTAEDALAITALLTAPEQRSVAMPAHLTDAIEDALAFHARDFAARDVKILRDFENDCCVVGDAQTLRQMLINVLADAAGLASPGQTLSLSAYRDVSYVHFTVTLASAPSTVASVNENESFAMLLARTLCELSGSRLLHRRTAQGGHDWAVSFTSAAQHELFAAA